MASVYRIFLKGLLTLLPLTLTLYLLIWVAAGAEGVFGPALRELLPQGWVFPGAGVIFVAALIFLTGLLVDNYLTKRFFAWLERQIEHMPVVRSIYGPLRDVTNLFANQQTAGAHQRVVMVRLDDHGSEILGLVTRDQFNDLPEGSVPADSVAVFIPFSYGMGGFTTIVTKSRIRETALQADRAMQLAITGWIKSSSSHG